VKLQRSFVQHLSHVDGARRDFHFCGLQQYHRWRRGGITG
jgi:hypothetical protein